MFLNVACNFGAMVMNVIIIFACHRPPATQHHVPVHVVKVVVAGATCHQARKLARHERTNQCDHHHHRNQNN